MRFRMSLARRIQPTTGMKRVSALPTSLRSPPLGRIFASCPGIFLTKSTMGASSLPMPPARPFRVGSLILPTRPLKAFPSLVPRPLSPSTRYMARRATSSTRDRRTPPSFVPTPLSALQAAPAARAMPVPIDRTALPSSLPRPFTLSQKYMARRAMSSATFRRSVPSFRFFSGARSLSSFRNLSAPPSALKKPVILMSAPPRTPSAPAPNPRIRPVQRTKSCWPSERPPYQSENFSAVSTTQVPRSRIMPPRSPRSLIRSPTSCWKFSLPSRLPSASEKSSTCGVMLVTSSSSRGPMFSTKSRRPGWSLSPALEKSRSMSLKAGPQDLAAVPTTPRSEPISEVIAPSPGPMSSMNDAMPVTNLPKPFWNLALLKPSSM